MEFFKRLIDIVTLGSDRPIRRLIAYYVVLALVVFLVFHFVPSAGRLVQGDHVQALVLDGLSGKEKDKAAEVPAETGGALAPETIVVMLSTLALMLLPVSWVFMSSRRARDFNQSVAQTLSSSSRSSSCRHRARRAHLPGARLFSWRDRRRASLSHDDARYP